MSAGSVFLGYQLKISIDEMVWVWCIGYCQAHQDLFDGFLLLWHSVLYTTESLSLLYLLLYLDLYVLGNNS